jgi:hypothetical protein
MRARYSIALDEEGEGHVIVTENGQLRSVHSDDIAFHDVLDAVINGASLAEVDEILERDNDHEDIVELTDRVTVGSGGLHLDGEPVPGTLASTITRYRREGRPFMGLVRFLERLDANPSRRSREQLFSWTSRHDLEIDEDGFLIGYKGVTTELTSISHGSAYVDDVLHKGAIPNRVGSVISMPREDVQDDPTVTCSYGLHVGNKQYAQDFGRTLLVVRVDPADVVSVPTDYDGQKMRCCRYEVLDVVEPEAELDFEPTGAEPDLEVIERLSEAIPEKFLSKLLGRYRKAATA